MSECSDGCRFRWESSARISNIASQVDERVAASCTSVLLVGTSPFIVFIRVGILILSYPSSFGTCFALLGAHLDFCLFHFAFWLAMFLSHFAPSKDAN
ncbi:hypothetical protein AAHA92_21803 [Salvia divinorum]|uniref:Uncharacterized protein n=1 Tax=Salvia divinorum TaxID=28513 RepID=A0ABD1GMU5_SALDI